ncbi:hypothetical protein MANY_14650 [Mycolicibacterium anyangense]|uniref:Uncharacterized protein n=1 Tax=Mycolicibacterium anyangense TaxID=1431246 RepID=A0A6N4W6H4_9MYCO|nr:hypothetical protein MANY_14650 [Mycolicibacterium anyangense]
MLPAASSPNTKFMLGVQGVPAATLRATLGRQLAESQDADAAGVDAIAAVSNPVTAAAIAILRILAPVQISPVASKIQDMSAVAKSSSQVGGAKLVSPFISQ